MNVMATEDSSIDTNAQAPTSGRREASGKLSSWSALPRALSRGRGVLITCGIVALWLVLFVVMLIGPVVLRDRRGRPVPDVSSQPDSSTPTSATSHASPSSPSSSSQSPSEIKSS